MVILLTAMAFVVINTGCGGLHRYDGRLVAADSLIQASPDSALAIVSAIDSLVTEGDRAYRDLLLTQARYKTYQDITAGDDSAVTRAMAWYRAHSGEREKLTRAYLYKGAVMQELGHVDSAMYYYKTAEVTADPKDYANLGQINTRIADLYRLYDGNEQTCFDKYQHALKYYTLTGNKKLQLNSLYNMFMMSGITHQEQRNEIFNNAVNLAQELGNEARLYKLYELKSRQLSLNDSTRREAKQIALECLENYKQFIDNDLMLDLAYLYTFENSLDSAKFYMNNLDELLNPSDEPRISVRKHAILALIAIREGNQSMSNLHLTEESRISDSILDNSDRYGLEKIENSFNGNQYNRSQSYVKRLRWGIIAISLIAILLITFLIAAYLRRVYRTKAILKELENIQLNHHDELLNQLDEKSAVVERLTSNMVALLKICSNHELQNSTTKLSQQIKETIVDVADDDFWNELKVYLDKHHNSIISNIERHPKFTKKDIKFIELCCCQFSNVEIAIVLGYTPKYVSDKRKIIAQKIGTDLSLQDYFNRLMREENSDSNYQKQ